MESKNIETLLSEIKNIEDYKIKFNALIASDITCRNCKKPIDKINNIGTIYYKAWVLDQSCIPPDTPDLLTRCTACEYIYRCKCGAKIKRDKQSTKSHFKTKKHQDFLKETL